MFNFLKKFIGIPEKKEEPQVEAPYKVEVRPPETWNNELQKSVPMDEQSTEQPVEEKKKRGRKKKE